MGALESLMAAAAEAAERAALGQTKDEARLITSEKSKGRGISLRGANGERTSAGGGTGNQRKTKERESDIMMWMAIDKVQVQVVVTKHCTLSETKGITRRGLTRRTRTSTGGETDIDKLAEKLTNRKMTMPIFRVSE